MSSLYGLEQELNGLSRVSPMQQRCNSRQHTVVDLPTENDEGLQGIALVRKLAAEGGELTAVRSGVNSRTGVAKELA